jgi:hypothetical protein
MQTATCTPPDFDVMGDIFIGWSNLPDLVMTTIADPPVTASAGGSCSVDEEVANHGTLSAGASTTRHYLSIDRRRSAGDGKADILWHQTTTGEVRMWWMDGATRLSETWVTTVPDVGYRIVK